MLFYHREDWADLGHSHSTAELLWCGWHELALLPLSRLGWDIVLLGTPWPPALERMWLGECGQLAPIPGSAVAVK